MTQDWTLDRLVKKLGETHPDNFLRFETAEGRAGRGYHVTELKRAAMSSIDCGGRLDSWDETQVQILDGKFGSPMRVGKFIAIARKSAAALPGLGKAPLSFEFAPKNRGLGKFKLAGVTTGEGETVIELSDGRAACKPAVQMAAACCAPSQLSRCCG